MINPQQLQAQLQSDIAACETLLDLLAAEREALTNREFETLDAIIEQKTEKLTVLEQSAILRSQWLQNFAQKQALSISEQKNLWETVMKDTTPNLKPTWEKLKTLQHKCKEENEINGKILAKNQKTFSRLLDIVRGQTAAPNLYSANGKSTTSGYSHKVGEA
ncbi:flagella synthesis protein FlgN [Alteromonadaceae bacterium 2753L.S.0a.02]|nr:flagella synthesis protein FlgN [Alteromonadaceae bacterium 2753L.S.0a.02]